MTKKGRKTAVSEETVYEIIRKYDQAELKMSHVYEGGLDGLWPRFSRAALNQTSDGEATLSRYAIWATTVRDNIVEALHCIQEEREEEAEKFLIRAANNLSAFSEVQSHFDPLRTSD